MEETLPVDYTVSETDDESGGSNMAVVGCLKVLAKDGEKERCYPVFKGTNTVGRSTSCQICIPIKAISKHHATILVEKESHFLQDNNSKNRTRRNKVLLKSMAYYELSNNCDLLFGDCACTYYTSREHWEQFVAKRDDDSQTLCETVAVTGGASIEEPLPVTPAAHDPASGSHDVTDALFSLDDMTDRTLPIATEQHTQLLLTADADGPTVTNGSESRGSSPLLVEQDHEATQLIPLTDVADHNDTNDHEEEPTIAYPIAAKSPSNSPADDIDATIPYDMTQGVNLLTKHRSASNSPDINDIENTIPYEMTQGVLGNDLTELPASKRSPVNDVEATIPYEMSDASSPACDPTEGVTEPTVRIDEPTVGVAESMMHIDEAEPTARVNESENDSAVGMAELTAHVDEPTVLVDEPPVGVAEPEAHTEEPSVGVAVSTDDVSTPDSLNTPDDLDETQSIDGNIANVPITDPAVGVAEAMDDNDATQTMDVMGVAEMDTGDATADRHTGSHDEETMNHSSSPVPPATSPTHSSPKASPVHKTTPILKNVTSPRSPTPKKVHFEPAKPSTLRLTPPPSGSGATVSLDNEESPDIELPPKRTFEEPHPSLTDGDGDKASTRNTTPTPTAATANTAAATRGGARRKGKAKSEATTSTRTRGKTTEKDTDATAKKVPAESKKGGAENRRGGARNKSTASNKTEGKQDVTTSSRTRRSAAEKAKNGKKNSTEDTAGAETATTKGKTTAKRNQPSRRGGKRKAATDLSTDSDETPSVTPITTPINESPSFLSDTDALFSGGGRIKRKYTDFLSTPKRDHLFRSPREGVSNKELTKSPVLEDPISTSHDPPTTSHDPPTTSHDPPAASHDPPATSLEHQSNSLPAESEESPIASHDQPTTSHDPPTTSHDPSTASHDTLPKVLFTGIVDTEGQKIVEELGGELVESVFECTHLVTDDKLRRTLKLLCCISRGCPIISTQWLKKCKQQKKFISAEPFIIKDKTFEKQRKCSLLTSLARARGGQPLLHNQQFYITPNVQPAPSEMGNIIKCSGGEVLDRMPLDGSDTVSIVTCDADLSKCKAASQGGVSLYSSEYLLSGILRQQLDPESHRLIVKEEERTGKNKRRASSSSSNESSTKRRRK